MRRQLALGIVVLALVTGGVLAQALRGFGPNEGEVLEVDPAAREITIRHGYLPQLDMDPMSMIFKVADPNLLDRVQKGDRVKFTPGLIEGRFAVMSIERIQRGPAASPDADK